MSSAMHRFVLCSICIVLEFTSFHSVTSSGTLGVSEKCPPSFSPSFLLLLFLFFPSFAPARLASLRPKKIALFCHKSTTSTCVWRLETSIAIGQKQEHHQLSLHRPHKSKKSPIHLDSLAINHRNNDIDQKYQRCCSLYQN